MKFLKSLLPTGFKSSNCFLLIVPATTFCLGCWQWRRHLWKTNLLNEIQEGMKKPPIPFPIDNLAELDKLEYQKVHIKGTFIFEKQFQIRWRSRLDGMHGEYDPDVGQSGSQIITPLRIDGTNLIILVNRGWMPSKAAINEIKTGKQKPPRMVEFNGVVRKSERSNLLKNHPESGIWVYKDIVQMARLCDSAPILVDAEYNGRVNDKYGNIIEPIGGQTNVTLRNEHFSYMLQWFALSALTLFMWCNRYMGITRTFRLLTTGPPNEERNPFKARGNRFTERRIP